MRSIERRFKKIAEKNPVWSSYICFAEAIKNQYFSKQSMSRWFNKLVEKDDYAKGEKRGILKYLMELSNPPKTTKNNSKMTSKKFKKRK